MRIPLRVALGLLAATLASVAVTACDLGLFGPSGSGVIQIRVISPHGPEGAAVLELTGGIGLGPVTTDVGDAYFRHDGATSRIVVLLDEPGEIAFQVRSTDIGKLPDTRIIEVADGDNRLRPSVTGYSIKFTRVEDLSGDLQRRAP